jgi:hypothetical protein
MQNRAIITGLMCILLLALLGCSEDSGPKRDPKCPLCEAGDYKDHVLKSCPITYRWNGLFYYWTSCDDNWTTVENQPIFTDLQDCLIAKGHLQDEKEIYWDNSQEDKDRHWAHKLFCFEADVAL